MTFTFPPSKQKWICATHFEFQYSEFPAQRIQPDENGQMYEIKFTLCFLGKIYIFADVGIMINFTRQAGQAKQLASDGYHCIAVERHCIVSIACMH